MKKRNLHISNTSRRISECNRRLNNLKKQGFEFSSDIWDELSDLRIKVLKKSIFHQIWNKKVTIILLLIIIFFSLFISFLIFFPRMEIEIYNLDDNTVIKENFSIFGKASYTNSLIPGLTSNRISTVEIKINKGSWEKVNLINDIWKYDCNISKLPEGNNTISLRCNNGIEFDYINIKFIIDKIHSVIVTGPEQRDNVSGIVNITGSTINGDIAGVEINFNQKNKSEWIKVNGTDNWYYNWNTTDFEDGFFDMYIRCYNETNVYSKNHHFFVIINNGNKDQDDINKNELLEYKMPTAGKFDLYIINKNLNFMKPGETYILEIKHRQKDGPYALDITTILDVQRKPDYLNIDLSNIIIDTPADGKIYNESIEVTIDDSAPKYVTTHFTIVYRYKTKFGLTQGKGLYDIQISTGSW